MRFNSKFFRKDKARGVIMLLLLSVFSLPFQNCSLGMFKTSLSDTLDLSSTSGGLSSSLSAPGPSPIRRLSNLEYKNSLNDAVTSQFSKQNATPAQITTVLNNSALVGTISALPADVSPKRLASDQIAAYLSPNRFSAYIEAANALANAVTKDAPTLKLFAGSCATSNADISNDTCVNSFLNSFGSLVFRKPVLANELAEIKLNATSWKDLIGRLLVHPRFLNHVEREGSLVATGVYRLSSYELEARLCSVFWKSVPDAAGLQAVAAGSLDSTVGLQTEVRRILASPKAKAAMWNFYQQWLGASRVPANLNATEPTFIAVSGGGFNTTNFHAHVLQDGQDFLDYITWSSRGSLSDLFRSPLLLTVDPVIASIYGVTARADSSQPPITDASGHYNGILTRMIVTTQKPSVSTEVNHIQRGVWLATNLLGIELGNPANFGDQNAQAKLVPANASTRVEVTVKTSPTSCQGCHSIINPAGFAMANYNSVGQYQTVENRYVSYNPGTGYTYKLVATNNIDASTTLVINGVTYPITGVPSLVDALFNSGQIYDAFARYYFRFAMGRVEVYPNDNLLLSTITQNLKTKSIADTLEAFAMDPNFALAKATE